MKTLTISLQRHMRCFVSIAILLSVSATAIAQVNETDMSLYTWKKSKTEPMHGYVLLRSGARLEGTIRLKGSPANVETVEFTNSTGEDTDLSPASLNAYGLLTPDGKPITATINDSPDELYRWGLVSETNGHVHHNTKWQPGYVVLRDSKTLEGELKLGTVDGQMTEVTIKQDVEGKTDFTLVQVANYGLKVRISDFNKNGEKVYKDPARNFTPGTITKADGSVLKGMVALVGQGAQAISDATYSSYGPVYYAADKDAFVTAFPANAVSKVEMEAGTGRLGYQNYEGALTSSAELLNPRDSKDDTKEWQTGHIILANGGRLEGKVQQVKSALTWFGSAINYQGADQTVTRYDPGSIGHFVQNINGVERKFINYSGVFVEMEKEGGKFRLYRNPFPVSEYSSLSWLAQTTTATLTDTLAREAAQSEFDASLNAGQDLTSSVDDAVAMQNAVNETGAAIGSMLVFKREEYIIEDMERGQLFTFNRKQFDEAVENLLNGCGQFLVMSKEEKRVYKDYDNRAMVVDLLNKCY